MAVNETMVTLVGTVASEVALSTASTGFSRAVFRMVSVERRFDRDLGRFVDGDRLFVSVTCWRGLAENVRASLGRGDPVVVTGKLRLHELRTEDVRRTHLSVEASAVGPNLLWCTAEPRRGGGPDPGFDPGSEPVSGVAGRGISESAGAAPTLPDVLAPRTEEQSVSVAEEALPVPF